MVMVMEDSEEEQLDRWWLRNSHPHENNNSLLSLSRRLVGVRRGFEREYRKSMNTTHL